MNINFCQTNNMHLGNIIAVKVNFGDARRFGKYLDNQTQVDTFILDFEKACDTLHMNSLEAIF